MGRYEQTVEQMVEQFKEMYSTITIEMLEQSPQMIVTKMIIEAFKKRGITETEALHIIANTDIDVTVFPENLDDLLDTFIDMLLKIKKLLTDAGYSQEFVDATTNKFSLQLT